MDASRKSQESAADDAEGGRAGSESGESYRSLKEQARVFEITLSSIPDFAYVFNREGRFVYANQALLDF